MNKQNFDKWFPKLERLDAEQLKEVAEKVNELVTKGSRKKVFSKEEFQQLLSTALQGKVDFEVDEYNNDDSVSVHFAMYTHNDDEENYYEEPEENSDDYY